MGVEGFGLAFTHIKPARLLRGRSAARPDAALDVAELLLNRRDF
jgi:hypothetical protein